LDDGYQKIEVAGDTVIDQKNCRVLQKTNIGYSYWNQDYYETDDGKIFIYEEDSVVYYRKNSQFYILYNFSAKPGDLYPSIGYPEYCNSEFTVKIDSIGQTTGTGQTLRKFYVTLNDSIQTYFIEKVGYPDYLLPLTDLGCVEATGPHFPGPLRCYSDNRTGVYSTNVVSACDYITSSEEILLDANPVKVFPNPSQRNKSIRVEINDKKIKRIVVYNLTGEKIKTFEINNEPDIKITIEKPGVYMVCFTGIGNTVLCREKVIVN
jgi:hypothetical protein